MFIIDVYFNKIIDVITIGNRSVHLGAFFHLFYGLVLCGFDCIVGKEWPPRALI